MIRTQIFIQNFELDLFPVNQFEINFSIKDVQELANKGTFTKSLSVPSTPKNDEAFGFLFNLNIIDGTFNPTIKNDCLVIVDSNQILDGYCELNSIKFVNKKPDVYEFTIYGENSNIFKNINDDTCLNDLTLSGLNHTFSHSNVSSSWNDFNDGNIDYVYPFIDYGKGENGWVGNIWGSYTPNYQSGSGITSIDLFPAVRTKYVFDKIFEEAGITYTSEFLNSSAFTQTIIPFHNDLSIWAKDRETDIYFTAAQAAAASAHILPYPGIPTNQMYDALGLLPNANGYYYQVSFGSTTYYPSIFCNLTQTYKNEFNKFTNAYTHWNNYTSLPNSYKILKKGKVKIEWGVKYVASGATTAGWYTYFSPTKTNIDNVNFDPYAQGAGATIYYKVYNRTALLNKISLSALTPNQIISGSCTVDVEVNDMIWVGKYWQNTNFTYDDAWMNISYIDSYDVGITQDFSNFFSSDDRVKQKDFISDVFKMFNLFCKTDKENQNNFIIEPYSNFYTGGGIKDWSNKIDLSTKNLNLLNNYKAYKFQYNAEDDYQSSNYLDNYKVTYPEYVLNSVNEFGDEKNLKLSTLSPTVLNSFKTFTIENNGFLVVSDMSKGDDQIETVPYNEYPDTKRKMRILYFNFEPLTLYSQISYPSWYDYHCYINGEYLINYPYAGHLNRAHNSDLDLNFNSVAENMLFVPTNYVSSAITNNNLFNLYYNNFVTQIGSPNSKILTAKFNLSPGDIATFDYSDKIYLETEQAYFIVQSIKYTPGELSDVELIKLDDIDIDYTQYQIDNKVWAPQKQPKLITNQVGNMILGTSLDNGLKTYGLVVGDDNVVESYTKTQIWCASTDGSYTYKAEEEMVPFSGYNFVVGSNNIVNGSNNVLINSNNINLSSNTSNLTLIGVSQFDTGYTYNSGDIVIGNNNAIVIGSGGTISISGTPSYLSASCQFTSGTSGNYSITSKGNLSGDAIGDYSFAVGYNSHAIGDVSFALGGSCSGTGIGSFAIGASTLANGYSSFCGGIGSIAYGYCSFVFSELSFANSNYATIIGGTNNNILTSANNSVIIGGKDNTIDNSNINASILGGNLNWVDGTNAAVVGGESNSANSSYCVAIGGQNNQADDSFAAVIGGANNLAHGAESAIIGGYSNTIYGDFSFIGGGRNNNINTNAIYSAIIGGSANTLTTTADYSVIIGGSLINATNPFTTYVSNFNINNTSKTGITAYELTADADGNVIFGESSEDLIYSTRIVVLSGDLLTVYSTIITAATINITTDQYVLPVECMAYFSGGTTNYSESSADYSFAIDITGEDTVSLSQIGAIQSLFSGVRSLSHFDNFEPTSFFAENNFYLVTVNSSSLSANPDAGDRQMIIDFKYKIKTIPSF